MLANGHNHSDFVCPLSDCSGLVCQNRIMGLIKIVEREQQELFYLEIYSLFTARAP